MLLRIVVQRFPSKEADTPSHFNMHLRSCSHLLFFQGSSSTTNLLRLRRLLLHPDIAGVKSLKSISIVRRLSEDFINRPPPLRTKYEIM